MEIKELILSSSKVIATKNIVYTLKKKKKRMQSMYV